MKTVSGITNDAYQLQQDLCGFHVGDIVVPLAVPVQGRFGWSTKQFIDNVFADMVGHSCTILDFYPDGVAIKYKEWVRKFPFYLLVPMGERDVDWKDSISEETPAPCMVWDHDPDHKQFAWVVEYAVGGAFVSVNGDGWLNATLAKPELLQTALETYYDEL